jgi:hypothetical protein
MESFKKATLNLKKLQGEGNASLYADEEIPKIAQRYVYHIDDLDLARQMIVGLPESMKDLKETFYPEDS